DEGDVGGEAVEVGFLEKIDDEDFGVFAEKGNQAVGLFADAGPVAIAQDEDAHRGGPNDQRPQGRGTVNSCSPKVYQNRGQRKAALRRRARASAARSARNLPAYRRRPTPGARRRPGCRTPAPARGVVRAFPAAPAAPAAASPGGAGTAGGRRTAPG